MTYFRLRPSSLLVLAVLLIGALALQAEEGTPTATVPARLTVTLSATGDGPVPTVNKDDVIVTQGRNNRRKVISWEAARGANAGLDLFILIDDALNTSVGSQLGNLRDFINAQPASTAVGVGYMSNATFQIVQNFTADHALAAKALRLPRGSPGAMGNPYRSVMALMNGWPQHQNRRGVIMVTDGIIRMRSGSGPNSRFLGTDPDVNSASSVAQRTGTIIYSLYSPGVGHFQRNFWEATNGQNGIARLSEESGGESFFLGLQAPVSFGPWLDSVQRLLDNQYILVFGASPNRRAGLQNVDLSTEVPGVELESARGVWLPAAGGQ
jgi:hypothetical protein